MNKPSKASVDLLIYAAAFVVGAAIFLPVHAHMITQRGYNAIGSEGFLLLLPVFIYLIKKCCIHTYKAFRSIYDERPKSWKEWGEW